MGIRGKSLEMMKKSESDRSSSLALTLTLTLTLFLYPERTKAATS
jgi:hypothetical protein